MVKAKRITDPISSETIRVFIQTCALRRSGEIKDDVCQTWGGFPRATGEGSAGWQWAAEVIWRGARYVLILAARFIDFPCSLRPRLPFITYIFWARWMVVLPTVVLFLVSPAASHPWQRHDWSAAALQKPQLFSLFVVKSHKSVKLFGPSYTRLMGIC